MAAMTPMRNEAAEAAAGTALDAIQRIRAGINGIGGLAYRAARGYRKTALITDFLALLDAEVARLAGVESQRDTPLSQSDDKIAP